MSTSTGPASRSKVGIVGAGAVGASLAYCAQIRGTAREIALYDLDAAKTQAQVSDLVHRQMFAPSVSLDGSDDIGVLAGSDVVVITAGAKQHHGQTRLDLAEANVRILRSLAPQLLEVAPDAVFVLVTNPNDVLTSVFQRLTGLPEHRVVSSGTVLDTSRLRHTLADRAQVNARSVHAMIIGEHGDSEFPLWSQANIGTVPLGEWADPDGRRLFTPEALEEIAGHTRTAAYRVIQGKGATNYAIGMCGTAICAAILEDSHAVMPVSTVLRDYREVSGVALSVPSVVGRRGVVQQLPIAMSDDEQRRFLASTEAIRASLRTVWF